MCNSFLHIEVEQCSFTHIYYTVYNYTTHHKCEHQIIGAQSRVLLHVQEHCGQIKRTQNNWGTQDSAHACAEALWSDQGGIK